MSVQELDAVPINAEGFAPFGELIERTAASQIPINEGRFDRFQELATVDTSEQGGFVNISIFSCRVTTHLPFEFEMLERHPLGTQAFMPLSSFPFIVVVAPPGDSVASSELRAFTTNGSQGVNLHRGVWHLPLIGRNVGEEFLVIDRGGGGNYDEFHLPSPITLDIK